MLPFPLLETGRLGDAVRVLVPEVVDKEGLKVDAMAVDIFGRGLGMNDVVVGAALGGTCTTGLTTGDAVRTATSDLTTGDAVTAAARCTAGIARRASRLRLRTESDAGAARAPVVAASVSRTRAKLREGVVGKAVGFMEGITRLSPCRLGDELIAATFDVVSGRNWSRSSSRRSSAFVARRSNDERGTINENDARLTMNKKDGVHPIMRTSTCTLLPR